MAERDLRTIPFWAGTPYDGTLGTANYPAWAPATPYVVGNIVTSGVTAYYCTANNTGQTPPNSLYWAAQPSILNPRAHSTVYGDPRDEFHVFPFLVTEPPPQVKWRLDSIWVQNISLLGEPVYVSVSVSNVGLLRSITLTPASQIYGSALAPTTHFRWGAELKAGETDAIDTGGLLVIGRSSAGAMDGQGLWAASWPGLNTNTVLQQPDHDLKMPAAVVSFNGVVLG